jgi:antitoxin (DNA-binding transcriptional repressor) of toxin-antitoxin stability system
MQVIGIYELKTRVAEVMRLVGTGERFTVTHRERPVGLLMPIEAAEAEPSPGEAWAGLWRVVAEIDQVEPIDLRPSHVILAEIRR